MGIGTANPLYGLHVASGDVALSIGRLLGFGDGEGAFRSYFSMEGADLTANVRFGDFAVATTDGLGALHTRMRIDNGFSRVTFPEASVQVGVGTSNPQHTLHVNGQAFFAEPPIFRGPIAGSYGWGRFVENTSPLVMSTFLVSETSPGKVVVSANGLSRGGRGQVEVFRNGISEGGISIQEEGSHAYVHVWDLGMLSIGDEIDVLAWSVNSSDPLILRDAELQLASSSGGGGIGGTGSAGRVAAFVGTDTLGDSTLYQVGSQIGVGTDVTVAPLTVAGDFAVKSSSGSGQVKMRFEDDGTANFGNPVNEGNVQVYAGAGALPGIVLEGATYFS